MAGVEGRLVDVGTQSHVIDLMAALRASLGASPAVSTPLATTTPAGEDAVALKTKKQESYEAEDQADVVQHFRDLAEVERVRVKQSKYKTDKIKAETRAEAFDEAATILDNTTVAEW